MPGAAQHARIVLVGHDDEQVRRLHGCSAGRWLAARHGWATGRRPDHLAHFTCGHGRPSSRRVAQRRLADVQRAQIPMPATNPRQQGFHGVRARTHGGLQARQPLAIQAAMVGPPPPSACVACRFEFPQRLLPDGAFPTLIPAPHRNQQHPSGGRHLDKRQPSTRRPLRHSGEGRNPVGRTWRPAGCLALSQLCPRYGTEPMLARLVRRGCVGDSVDACADACRTTGPRPSPG